MKNLILTSLCLFSILYGAPLDPVTQSDEFLFNTQFSKNGTALDGSSLSQIAPELRQPPSIIPSSNRKSSAVAVGLSCVLPGLGHVYLGDIQTASGLAVTSCLGYTLALLPDAESRSIGDLTAQTSLFYGLYAAYRDVRHHNKESGYSYKMPTESLFELACAPISPSILKKPEVWGGLLGTLAIAVGVAHLAFPQDSTAHLSLSSRTARTPLRAFPVGVGEESFFRGYLQSQLSEYCTPCGGIILSSLAFGAAHIPNAQALEPKHRWRYYSCSLPIITAAGAYFGYLTHKNHSLKESVAIHVWYDFILFSVDYLARQSAATQEPSTFIFSAPF